MFKTIQKKGFTLIELILYSAVVSIIVAALLPFSINIMQLSAQSSVEQEINDNARFIMETIKREIRDSVSLLAATDTSITLQKSNPTQNPTVISFDSGNLTISRSGVPAVNLNSGDIQIESLTFTNYSSIDNTTENIQFEINMSYKGNQSARREFQNQVVLRSAAEVRSL